MPASLTAQLRENAAVVFGEASAARQALPAQGAAGDWQSLAQRNLALVKYVLSKVAKSLPVSVDREDLFSAGLLGLTEAAKRFSAARNVPFPSYAIPRIYGAMLDELRSHDWLSSDMRAQVKRLRETQEALRSANSGAVSGSELAGRMGCDEERLLRLLAVSQADMKKREGELHAPDFASLPAVASGFNDPYKEVELSDLKRFLADAIAELPERERQVIILRYNEGLLLQEIGSAMRVTESRVCQLHGQAVARLKRMLKQVL